MVTEIELEDKMEMAHLQDDNTKTAVSSGELTFSQNGRVLSIRGKSQQDKFIARTDTNTPVGASKRIYGKLDAYF